MGIGSPRLARRHAAGLAPIDFLNSAKLAFCSSLHAATARAHCVVYQLRREVIAGLLANNAEVAAALEKSVRRGLELVNRRVAATAAGDVGVRGQLLQRIRRFFRSDAG